MTTDFSEDKFNWKMLCLNLNFIFTGLFEWKRLNLQAAEYDERFIYTSYTTLELWTYGKGHLNKKGEKNLPSEAYQKTMVWAIFFQILLLNLPTWAARNFQVLVFPFPSLLLENSVKQFHVRVNMQWSLWQSPTALKGFSGYL